MRFQPVSEIGILDWVNGAPRTFGWIYDMIMMTTDCIFLDVFVLVLLLNNQDDMTNIHRVMDDRHKLGNRDGSITAVGVSLRES